MSDCKDTCIFWMLQINDFDSTKSVQVGDIFLVQGDTDHSVLKVTEVNVKVADNSDNYVFDVKK